MSPLDPITWLGAAVILVVMLLLGVHRWPALVRMLLVVPFSGYFIYAAYTATSTGGRIAATALAVLLPAILAVQVWRERRAGDT
jgi:hypothetical protein